MGLGPVQVERRRLLLSLHSLPLRRRCASALIMTLCTLFHLIPGYHPAQTQLKFTQPSFIQSRQQRRACRPAAHCVRCPPGHALLAAWAATSQAACSPGGACNSVASLGAASPSYRPPPPPAARKPALPLVTWPAVKTGALPSQTPGPAPRTLYPSLPAPAAAAAAAEWQRRKPRTRRWRASASARRLPGPAPPRAAAFTATCRWSGWVEVKRGVGSSQTINFEQLVQHPHPFPWPIRRQVDSLHCRVEGKLPAWLQGSLYRNGPGECGGAGAGRGAAALQLLPPPSRCRPAGARPPPPLPNPQASLAAPCR